MGYGDLSREQLLQELGRLRLRVAELELLETKLKYTENARREIEEFHRLILENPMFGVGLSRGNKILYASTLLLQMFGYTDLDEFLSIPLIDHVAPSSRPAIMERQEKVANGLATGSNLTYEVIRKDGSIRTLEVDVVPYKWMGTPCRLSLFRDITDRKRAEEALRESEGKYRALVEITGTGYVIIDSEGRVLDANQEFVRLTGHSALADILHRQVTEWTAAHDRERNAECVKECVERGLIRNLTIDYVNSQGEHTPVEINATVLKTAEGIKVLTLCRDITERRRLETQLQHAQKMEATGLLSGGVAGELNFRIKT